MVFFGSQQLGSTEEASLKMEAHEVTPTPDMCHFNEEELSTLHIRHSDLICSDVICSRTLHHAHMTRNCPYVYACRLSEDNALTDVTSHRCRLDIASYLYAFQRYPLPSMR